MLYFFKFTRYFCRIFETSRNTGEQTTDNKWLIISENNDPVALPSSLSSHVMLANKNKMYIIEGNKKMIIHIYKKQSFPAYSMEGKTTNADICNEFGVAFIVTLLLIQETISCYKMSMYLHLRNMLKKR